MELNDTALKFKNPEASGELIMPVQMVAAVPFEQMKSNVAENMSHPIWLNESPQHNGVAVLCGNGPSLSDTLDEIRLLNGTVFASNDASNKLSDNGIAVDYQVILEPLSIIVEQLDMRAKMHLFGSMAEPELFKRCPDAILWHPYSPWIWEMIPENHPPFVYVGGEFTVSTYALSIIYTMGFREIHVFGMDSSHRDGKEHSTRDFKVDGTLYVDVEAFGKKYRTSYDMKEQVRVFMIMREQLAKLGCSLSVYGDGLLPDVFKATCSRHSEQNSTT